MAQENANKQSTSNCDDLSIRKLELLIQVEEAKPENERDIDFIDECINEIAEIKKIRASFSSDEINENIAILKNQSEGKHSSKLRRKTVKWLIPIAAVFLLSSILVCAFPENRLAVANLTKKVLESLHVKTVYQEDNIDLILTDDIVSYSSLQELSDGCGLPILLPYDIEDLMDDLRIILSDLGESSMINMNFMMNNESCSIFMKGIYESEDTTIEYFDVETGCQATWVYKQIYYVVEAGNRSNTEFIVENMR